MAKTPAAAPPATDQQGLPSADQTPSDTIPPLVLVLDRVEGLKAHLKTTGGTVPVSYDFGDGTTHTPSDGRDTAHTYAAEGEYTVKVTDADGLTASLVIGVGVEVEPGPEPEPSSPYDEAVAFKPDPWDQLPEDPEVRRLYLAIHGEIAAFVGKGR